MAERSADFNPNGPCGDAKRRKMEHKKQDALKQSSMEREEAELKQKIREAKVAAESYKLKSENIEDEILELEQREEDLCNRIRKADEDANAYRFEAEMFAQSKVVLSFDDLLRMYAPVEVALFHQEEIPCGSDDAGVPTDTYYGCPGDERDCDHSLKLPRNDPSPSFGSSYSPIVSPSSRRLRSFLSVSDAMQELPIDGPKERRTAKRRKLQAKQHLNSVEIEAELKQELEEANREAEFYKDKCDFVQYELDECRQRGKDLLQKLSKAKIRAEEYQRDADVLGEHFCDKWLREIQGRPVVAAAAAESVPEEILCCYDTGHPTEVCQCCGDEEACMVVLPCNCLSLCMMCETETDTCPKCSSVKTGCFWTDMANQVVCIGISDLV